MSSSSLISLNLKKKVEQIQTGEYIRGESSISDFIDQIKQGEKRIQTSKQTREMIHTLSCNPMPDNS